MSTLHEPFSGLLVDASDGHDKRGGQHEASCSGLVAGFDEIVDHRSAVLGSVSANAACMRSSTSELLL